MPAHANPSPNQSGSSTFQHSPASNQQLLPQRYNQTPQYAAPRHPDFIGPWYCWLLTTLHQAHHNSHHVLSSLAVGGGGGENAPRICLQQWLRTVRSYITVRMVEAVNRARIRLWETCKVGSEWRFYLVSYWNEVDRTPSDRHWWVNIVDLKTATWKKK